MARGIFSRKEKENREAPKSAINTCANRAIDGISNAFDGSAIFTWLSTYPQFSDHSERGIFKTFFRKLGRAFNKMRRFITRFIEESRGIEAVKSMLRVFLEADLTSWGICFLVSGIVTTVGKMIAAGYSEVMSGRAIESYFGILLLLIGVLMIATKDSVGRTIVSSPFLRFIFVDIFCVNENELISCEPQKQYSAFAVLGVLLGACNIYFPVWMPLAVVAAVLAAAIVLCQPEIGITAIVAILPFTTTKVLIVMALITVVSFIIKLVRGKRVVKIGIVDTAVMFYGTALAVFGWALSNNRAESLNIVLLYLLFIAVYFAIASSMSSRKWVDNLAAIMILGGAIIGIIGIYQYVSGYVANPDWIDSNTFTSISTRVVATFGNPNVLGEYLILLIPIALCFAIIKSGKIRLLSFISALIMLVCLVMTYSRGAWLGIIIALILFAVIYNKKVLKALPFIAAIIPLIVVFLPTSVVERFASIGNAAESSTAYRLNVWRGTLELLRESWYSGVGMGDNVFAQAYQLHALENTAAAAHSHSLYLQVFSALGIVGFIALLALIISVARLCLDGFYTMQKHRSGVMMLGLGAGILAFLIHGITDNVWYNNRIVLLFWIILGMTVVRSRTYNSEWNDTERGE